MKNNRAIGKTLSRDQRTTTINDLDIGNRYSIQILPVTDQPGGTALRTGEGQIFAFRLSFTGLCMCRIQC